MVFKSVNIVDKLAVLQHKEFHETQLLHEVASIIAQPTPIERIGQHHKSGINHLNFGLLDTKKIFHISQIQTVCIDYRLRFLSINMFKGILPVEALQKIEELEKCHQVAIQNLQIIAPSKLFRLNNADDPALFAPIGNNYYYLVHQWGNNLHPFRKILMFPFKNYLNLAIFTFLCSLLVTKLIPLSLFTRHPQDSYFWILLLFNFKGIASIILFYCFSCGKNVSSAVWRSKYFNA